MKHFFKPVSKCLSVALIGILSFPLFSFAQYASYEDEVRVNEVENQIQIDSKYFFPDTNTSSREGRAAAYLHGLGIIGGFPDGEFKGDQLVNRAEFAKFLLLASATTVGDLKNNGTFSDVKEGEWYVKYVMTAHERGIINGYPDGLFRPAKSVNTAEALKMATKAFSLDENMDHNYTDVSPADWFDPYAGMASFYTLFPERSDTLLEPAALLTRNEVAVMIYQYLTWGMMNADTPPSPPSPGDAYDPVSDEIPAEAQEAVQYLIDHNVISENDFSPNTAIDLSTAAEWLVKTKNMTLDLGGVRFPDLPVSHPGYTYLQTLYNYNIWNGEPTGKMLPDKKISRAEAAKLIVNGFELINSVGSTQYVFKDVKPADWFFDYAWIAYKNNLMTTIAKIQFGPHEKISEAKFAKILYDANNLIADESPLVEDGLSVSLSSQTPSQQKISACSKDIVFTTFDMSAGEGDIRLDTITVARMGLGDSHDFENVRIERNGNTMTDKKSFNNDDVVEFRFPTWFRIQSGKTETFNIVADLKCSGDDTNVGHHSSFIIKDETNITSSALVISGSFPIEGNEVEIVENGQTREELPNVLVSRDPSSPENMNYSAGELNTVGLIIRAQTDFDEPVIVDGLILRVDSNTEILDENGNETNDITYLQDSFENVRLYLNNELVDSEQMFLGETIDDAYIEFNTTFEIHDIDQLKFLLNISDSAKSRSKLKVSFDSQDFIDPEYISTGNPVPEDNLIGSAKGSFLEIENSFLQISRSDDISDGEIIIAGVDDVTVLKWTLDANDATDVNLSSLSLRAEGTGNAIPYANFTGAIFVDGVQHGSSKNINANGTIDFNDLSFVIHSATQDEFTFVVNTTEASANGTIQFFVTGVDATSIVNGIDVTTFYNEQELSGDNPVEGAEFQLIKSGDLSVQRGVLIPGRALQSEEENVDLLNIEFSALYDDISVKDIYLMNDVDGDGVADDPEVGALLDFKLYNEVGQLIQQKQMHLDGVVHFELANQDRINIDENGVQTVTIKGDVRNLNEGNSQFEGNQLRLVLDSTPPYKGIEAITMATGNDIDTLADGWGTAESEIFTFDWE